MRRRSDHKPYDNNTLSYLATVLRVTKSIRNQVAIGLFFVISTSAIAQKKLTFYHLDKSDGLSDNTVMSVVTDQNGFVWVGTSDGLNSYDGYSVTRYYSRDHPGLANDNIVRMVCDAKNRIWIQCANGQLSLLDEKRKFHAIDLTAGDKKIKVDYLMPVPEKPMFIYGGQLFGLQNENDNVFAPIEMKTEPLLSGHFERVNRWDADNLVFSGNDILFLLQISTCKVTKVLHVPGVVAAEKIADDIALITTSDNKRLLKVSFSSGIIKTFSAIKDQYGETMHKLPGSIKRFHDNLFLITSPSAGVYVFDSDSEMLTRHHQDILDERSISTNHTSYIFTNDNGYIFIGSFGNGLDYFLHGSPLMNITNIFQDRKTGQFYGSYVNTIAEGKNGNIWMGGSNILIERISTSGEINLHKLDWSNEEDHRGGIRSLYIDSKDRLWAGFHNGLAVFDQNVKRITYFNKKTGLPDRTVNAITEGPDGSLWISTTNGICFIDPNTFEVTIPSTKSPLSWVQGKKCNSVWFRNNEEVWIATWEGACKVNLSSGDSNVYTTDNGLLFNEVIGFAGDHNNNIYIGTRDGFHILASGREMRSFKTIMDTWSVDCYSLVKDHSDNIWFSGNNYLARYSPTTQDFKVYDDKTGINASGFRFYAAHAASNGELYFGSNKGITNFNPDRFETPAITPSVFVRQMVTVDSIYSIVPDEEIELPPTNHAISFSFSVIDLLRGKNIFYQYQLEGLDEQWIDVTSAPQVTYTNLQPGSYRFSVKASNDRINWVGAANPAMFRIMTPWWEQYWFRIPALVLIGSIVVAIIRQRNKEVKQQRENLETERAINYLSTSIHEQKTVDAILWDVAKNCISQLQFEDCVIYLKDDVRNVLVQKAAWGPKTSMEDRIVNPIEIPLGKGIVGSVAKSAVAEIVKDTSKDSRYIVDDAIRRSEITVPIAYEGRVLGIIDSEHSKKGFFTQKHLSILTTIASICAHKIERARAEKEKQEAQLATLQHEREAIEAQLKSLRLQMNPHFLFNSLNAIQQMILGGEDRNATRYLSKFSRLLRLVLVHSDKENITLKEELETLNLYVELESLRFKESFHYAIICDERIDTEEVKVPVMLMQPFVENAIWHGLLHKKGDRHLRIEFCETSSDSIRCTIEDNGIGRMAAGSINNGSHTQKGIAVAQERLKTHNVQNNVHNKVILQDLIDEFGNATGTRVIITLH